MSDKISADRRRPETRKRKFLVMGATGHVGSKVAIRLAEKGYDVTALVRRDGARILDPFNGAMKYAVGDLTHLAFGSASFDLVWTQHVVMNIRDRAALYREFRRVLKSGGKFAFYDIITGDGGASPIYPVPWAETAQTSTLLTEAQTGTALEKAGLKRVRWDDVTTIAFEWMAAQRQASPLAVGPGLMVGQRMAEMVSNFGRNLKEGLTNLVIGVCETVSA